MDGSHEADRSCTDSCTGVLESHTSVVINRGPRCVPMLKIYRRHSRYKCQYRSVDQRKCSCPVWVRGNVKGVDVRRSVETSSWEEARTLVQKWELQGFIDLQLGLRTGSQQSGIQDSQAANLSELPTVESAV